MRISFKNFGVLKEAEIDLSKDLIILCGPNNTGKTYVAYAVYGLTTISSRNMPDLIKANIIDESVLNQKGEIQLDLLDLFNKHKHAIESDFSKQLLNNLFEIFGTNKFFFKETAITVSFPNSSSVENNILNSSANNYMRTGGLRIDLVKNLNSILLSIKSNQQQSENNNYISIDIIFDILFYCIARRIHIAPAERIAINIFNKEILRNRSELVDEVLRLEKRDSAFDLIRKNVSEYSLPIKDSLEIANTLYIKQKQRSDFASFADEIEQTILGGKISVTDENVVQFSPDGVKGKKLDIHLSASIVKSLASIVFYFRHLAQPNDLIIIDEPELNLHPDMQRKVARILAKAVNKGFRIIISTHSDYIIRELNNLIMLHQESAKAVELRQKYNYTDDETLDYTRVGAYLFHHQKSTTLPVTDSGFEVETIDEEINQLNLESQDIYFSLFD